MALALITSLPQNGWYSVPWFDAYHVLHRTLVDASYLQSVLNGIHYGTITPETLKPRPRTKR